MKDRAAAKQTAAELERDIARLSRYVRPLEMASMRSDGEFWDVADYMIRISRGITHLKVYAERLKDQLERDQ